MLFLSASSSSTGTGSWSTFNMIAQLFFILIVFVGVAILAVYVTRLMGRANYVKKGGGNLKIIESLGLGFQNGIHLVKAGKKYILLGITKDRITFLCELNEGDIDNYNEIAKNQPSFDNYLNRVLNRKERDS